MSALILFAPTTFYLGMVSPYVAKLALNKLSKSGEIIGKLYAMGTFGSIAGTFLTGYYLINYVGNRQLYWIFVSALFGLAIICYQTSKIFGSIKNTTILVMVGGLLFILANSTDNQALGTVFAKDTAYSSYKVKDVYYKGQPTRLLITDNGGAQSGVLISDPLSPPFAYIDSLIQVVKNHEKTPNRLLMIGGGTYTLPTILNNSYPDMQIDVVEIDPGLDSVAKTYFNFKPTANINIIHEDGRTFLNKNTIKYDVIILDAYNSLRPPFQLMTDEAVAKMRESLEPGGVIASNVIASLSGERSEFGASVEKTFGNNFDTVSVFFTEERPADQQQNLLFLVSDDTEKINLLSKNFKSAKINKNGQLLTDNYAPLEKLLGDY